MRAHTRYTVDDTSMVPSTVATTSVGEATDVESVNVALMVIQATSE